MDPAFVEGLQEEGYEGLTPGELIELRRSGVTPRYVSRLKEAGYEDLTVTQLVALRTSGVEPEADDKRCADRKRHSREEEL